MYLKQEKGNKSFNILSFVSHTNLKKLKHISFEIHFIKMENKSSITFLLHLLNQNLIHYHKLGHLDLALGCMPKQFPHAVQNHHANKSDGL